MNSLSQLNTWGATSYDAADSRPSGIVLDRTPAENQVVNIVSTTVALTAPVNILEVINYDTANVRLRVTPTNAGTPALTGSTLSWASIPSGVNLNLADGVYTLDGIDSKALWDGINEFTWNLPSNWASCPLWFLDVAILFYNGETQEENTISWSVFDPDFYYIAKLPATASLVANNTRIKSATATMVVNASVVAGFKAVGLESAMIARVTVSASPEKNAVNVRMISTASTTVMLSRQTLSSSTMASSFTVNASIDLAVSGMINRKYYKNNVRSLFTASNGGKALTFSRPETTAVFNITITSSIPETVYDPAQFTQVDATYAGICDTDINPNFGTPKGKSVTYEGLTISQVNTKLSQMLFYPVVNVNYSSTITVTLQKQLPNNTLETLYTKAINITEDSTIVPISGSYELTYNGVSSYRKLNTKTSERLYGAYTAIMVAGGGGGQYGGGGGGEALQIQRNFASNGENFIIGAGGQGAYGANATLYVTAVNGTETVLSTNSGVVTAVGGRAATTIGGNSGNGNAGGQFTWGGGGGAGGATVTYPTTGYKNGGPGAVLSLTGLRYAAGGGGGGGTAGTSTSNYGQGGQGFVSIPSNGTIQAGNGSNGYIFIQVEPRY